MILPLSARSVDSAALVFREKKLSAGNMVLGLQRGKVPLDPMPYYYSQPLNTAHKDQIAATRTPTLCGFYHLHLRCYKIVYSFSFSFARFLFESAALCYHYTTAIPMPYFRREIITFFPFQEAQNPSFPQPFCHLHGFFTSIPAKGLDFEAARSDIFLSFLAFGMKTAFPPDRPRRERNFPC